MAISFLPNNSFPLPASLTPTLLALGLDNKTAATVSTIYHSAALKLKETYEKEYNHACSAIVATSDNRGHSSKELRSKLLTVIITRYNQAVSKWKEEALKKAEASLSRRSKKPSLHVKAKSTSTSPQKQSREDTPKPNESAPVSKNDLLRADSPPHAFPRAYPPPVRPGSISFATHISPSEKRPRIEQRITSSNDLDACIDALSRLSLGPPSPQKSSPTPSKIPKSRSRARAPSRPKPPLQLSPSRPRLVSPMLDKSFAVSDSSPTKTTPSHLSLITPPTQNIEIPRSTRRKVCSIPYRRPPTHATTSPESSHFSRSIRRTPSLISDQGSEASSPSTPPDFPFMPIPPSTVPRKDLSPEALSLEQFLAPYPESGWQDINFGTDLFG